MLTVRKFFLIQIFLVYSSLHSISIYWIVCSKDCTLCSHICKSSSSTAQGQAAILFFSDIWRQQGWNNKFVLQSESPQFLQSTSFRVVFIAFLLPSPLSSTYFLSSAASRPSETLLWCLFEQGHHLPQGGSLQNSGLWCIISKQWPSLGISRND